MPYNENNISTDMATWNTLVITQPEACNKLARPVRGKGGRWIKVYST